MKRYYEPTPRWARKLGDALMAASATITTYAIADNHETLALIALWGGVAGKFLTNLFSEETQQAETSDAAKNHPGNNNNLVGPRPGDR